MNLNHFTRTIPLTSATWDGTKYTFVSSSNHLLVTGDEVQINKKNENRRAVTVTNATTFSTAVQSDFTPSVTNVYATSFITQGDISDVMSFGGTTDPIKSIQLIGNTTSGAGSAVVDVQVSNDGVNFKNLGSSMNLTLATTPDNAILSVDSAFGFMRIKVTTLTGTGAKIKVIVGSV